MPDFLRQPAPRQADALQPASPLRPMAWPGPAAAMDGIEPQDGATMHAHDEAADRPGVPALPPTAHRQSPVAGEPPLAALPSQPRQVAPAHRLRGETNATAQASTAEPAAARLQSPRIATAPVRVAEPPFAAIDDVRQPLQADPPAIARPSADPAGIAAVAAPISPATVARFVQEHASPAPPPAIHVSIDRIDVRARSAAPSPAASRPRAMREPQSLHDYLRGKATP
ncbi:hypothetical protein CSC71_10685 [Pseudoxanthomonas sangjuensis]|uniref:hypothetical protein n=1 Tax=Pseudoxanthomonas sangjuensis TaxID=1503750 RepID=UPI001390D6F6|nr:hypothetical protein [Pseudoxanthomonas sangjuensis]KAF1709701.1 hypothetical protein CSC71_10685 [Pseudoxanthomonas sangjuensis]